MKQDFSSSLKKQTNILKNDTTKNNPCLVNYMIKKETEKYN